VKPGDENIRRFGIGRDARAVDGEKGVGGGEGRPLVAVDEGMVLREAFPQGGGLLDEVGVVAGLRAVESGFQQAAVADAVGPAVALYWSSWMASTSARVRRARFFYTQGLRFSQLCRFPRGQLLLIFLNSSPRRRCWPNRFMLNLGSLQSPLNRANKPLRVTSETIMANFHRISTNQ
jgi:hypothetical protein